MSSDKVRPPCLYLLWPRLKRDAPESAVPVGYELRTYREGDDHSLLELQGSDGEPMSEAEWQRYRDILLPSGLFIVEEAASTGLVDRRGGTQSQPGPLLLPLRRRTRVLDRAAGASPTRPRRRGLRGRRWAIPVGGYDNIRTCVQEHRLAAIQTYLRVGFEPLLTSADVERRWQSVCRVMGLPFTPELWPRGLQIEG